MYQSYKMDLAGRPLVVDINRVGKQANGCARDVLAGGTNVIYAPKLGADGTETAVTSRKALDTPLTLRV